MPAATKEKGSLPASTEPEAEEFLDFGGDGSTKDTDYPTELGGETTNPSDTKGARLPDDTGLSEQEKALADAFDIRDPSEEPKPDTKPKDEKAEGAEGEPEPEGSEEFDDRLLSVAASMGINPEAARKWPGGAEGLSQAIQYGQYLVNTNRNGQGANAGAAPEQGGPQGKKSEPIDEFKVDLDPEKYDEELIKVVQSVVKGANTHFAKYGEKITQLEGQLNSLVEGVRGQQATSAEQQFDKTIADLGDDVVPLLGKGPSRALTKSSKEFRNRQKVADTMIRLADFFDQQGLSDSERMERAIDAALGNQSKKTITRKISNQLRDQNGKFVTRAPQRGRQTVGKGGGADPEREAKEFAAEKLREAGMGEEEFA